MNVIQRPRTEEFCGTMQDYIIDTDATILFAVKYGGKVILEEVYSPDANFQVRVRKLGKFCELVLWGVWCAGESSWQTDAAGTFTFLINSVQDGESYVMFSRMQTKKLAVAPGWLSDVREKVTRQGAKEYASMVLASGEKVLLNIRTIEGAVFSKSLYTHNGGKLPVTLDVSPDKVFALITNLTGNVGSYELLRGSDVMKFLVDQTRYVEMQCFRYKNVYDMPEALTTVGGLKMKGGNNSDAAAMWGVERKFGVEVTDEYTANSGVVFLQSDYKLWHNMMNAQETQILIDGEWYPIVITKQNYEREFQRSVLKAVEFSFKMADANQNNMIEV